MPKRLLLITGVALWLACAESKALVIEAKEMGVDSIGINIGDKD